MPRKPQNPPTPPVLKPANAHTMLTDALRRIAELERRANNVIRQFKVTDVDQDKGLVRGYFEQTPEKIEVLTPFVRFQQDKSGNERRHRLPTPGEQCHIYSPSGEVGLHSWVIPGGFTSQPGEVIDNSKPFKYSEGEKWYHVRDTSEIIQEEPTLNKLGVGGAQACPTTEKAKPTKAIKSDLWSPEAHERVIVSKEDDQQQTNPHKACWDKRKKGVQTQTNCRGPQKIITAEDREAREVTIRHQDAVRYNVLAQTNSDSAQKEHNAALHQVLVKDAAGQILKPLVEEYMGGGADSAGGGGGSNSTIRKIMKTLHYIKSLASSNFTERELVPGIYTRITNLMGASRTEVKQRGGLHHIEADTKINRHTQTYLNNALQRLVEHAGQTMRLNSGGSMGISSGGRTTIAAGGVLKLAGHLVKIGGPVKLKKSFLGWGGSTPGGGGSGSVSGGGPGEEGEESQETEESPPPEDEYYLEERLEAIEAACIQPGDVIVTFDEAARTGFAPLDGSTVSAADNPKVAARYPWMVSGGDIHLPDMRGLFLRGWADSSSNDPDRSSRTARVGDGQTGDHPGTYQLDALQDHAHDADTNPFFWGSGGSGALGGGGSIGSSYPHGGDVTAPPARVSTETRATNIAVTYLMKLDHLSTYVPPPDEYDYFIVPTSLTTDAPTIGEPSLTENTVSGGNGEPPVP